MKKYELVFDRYGSRKVLIEALDEVEVRLIIVCPWLRDTAIDQEIINMFKNLLYLGVSINIGWGNLGDVMRCGFIQKPYKTFLRKQLINMDQKYSALNKLEELENQYPELFKLKLLGTHEKFLVCDEKFAMLGSHNLLASDNLSKEREIGLRTTDSDIIHGLIARFDNARCFECSPFSFSNDINLEILDYDNIPFFE